MANDDEIALKGVEEEAQAYNSYQEKARNAKSPALKETLKDVADEEIVHAGEFAQRAIEARPELKDLMKEGVEEAKEVKKSGTGTIEKRYLELDLKTNRAAARGADNAYNLTHWKYEALKDDRKHEPKDQKTPIDKHRAEMKKLREKMAVANDVSDRASSAVKREKDNRDKLPGKGKGVSPQDIGKSSTGSIEKARDSQLDYKKFGDAWNAIGRLYRANPNDKKLEDHNTRVEDAFNYAKQSAVFNVNKAPEDVNQKYEIYGPNYGRGIPMHELGHSMSKDMVDAMNGAKSNASTSVPTNEIHETGHMFRDPLDNVPVSPDRYSRYTGLKAMPTFKELMDSKVKKARDTEIDLPKYEGAVIGAFNAVDKFDLDAGYAGRAENKKSATEQIEKANVSGAEENQKNLKEGKKGIDRAAHELHGKSEYAKRMVEEMGEPAADPRYPLGSAVNAVMHNAYKEAFKRGSEKDEKKALAADAKSKEIEEKLTKKSASPAIPSFRSMMGMEKPIVKSGGGLYNHSAFGVAYIGGGKKDNSLTTKRRFANRDDETGKFTTKKLEVEGCTKEEVDLKSVKHLEKSWGGVDNPGLSGKEINIGPYKFKEDTYGGWYSKSGRYCIRQAGSGWIIQDTFVDGGPEVMKLSTFPDLDDESINQITEFIVDGTDDHLEMDDKGDGGDQDFRTSQNDDAVNSGESKISKAELVDFLNDLKTSRITKANFRGKKEIYGKSPKDLAREVLKEGEVDVEGVRKIKDANGKEHEGIIKDMGLIDKFIAKGPAFGAYDTLVDLKRKNPVLDFKNGKYWVYGEDGHWYKVYRKEVTYTDSTGKEYKEIKTPRTGKGALDFYYDPVSGNIKGMTGLAGLADKKTRDHITRQRGHQMTVAEAKAYLADKEMNEKEEMFSENNKQWDKIAQQYVNETYKLFKAKMFGKYYEPKFFFDNSELNNKIVKDLLFDRQMDVDTVRETIVTYLDEIGLTNLDLDGTALDGLNLKYFTPKEVNIMFALGGAIPARGIDGDPSFGVSQYRMKLADVNTSERGKAEIKRLLADSKGMAGAKRGSVIGAVANVGLADIYGPDSDEYKYQKRNGLGDATWKNYVSQQIIDGIKTNDTQSIIDTLKMYNLSDYDDITNLVREQMFKKYLGYGLDANRAEWKDRKRIEIMNEMRANGTYNDKAYKAACKAAFKAHDIEQDAIIEQMNQRTDKLLGDILVNIPELENVVGFANRSKIKFQEEYGNYVPDIDKEVDILANMIFEDNQKGGKSTSLPPLIRDNVRAGLIDKLKTQREWAKVHKLHEIKTTIGDGKRGRKKKGPIDMSNIGGVKGWNDQIKDDDAIMTMWPFYIMLDKAWNNKKYLGKYNDDGTLNDDWEMGDDFKIEREEGPEGEDMDKDIGKSNSNFMDFVHAIRKSNDLSWLRPLMNGGHIRKADDDYWIDEYGALRRKKPFNIVVPWVDARDTFLRAKGINKDEVIEGMMTPAEIAARAFIDIDGRGKHRDFIETLLAFEDWFEKHKLNTKDFDPKKHKPVLTIDKIEPGQFPEFEWLTHTREKQKKAEELDEKNQEKLKAAIESKGVEGVKRDIAIKLATKCKADPTVYKDIMDTIRKQVDEANAVWEILHPGEKGHFTIYEWGNKPKVVVNGESGVIEETTEPDEPDKTIAPVDVDSEYLDKLKSKMKDQTKPRDQSSMPTTSAPGMTVRTESGKPIKTDKDLHNAMKDKKDIDNSIPKKRSMRTNRH